MVARSFPTCWHVHYIVLSNLTSLEVELKDDPSESTGSGVLDSWWAVRLFGAQWCEVPSGGLSGADVCSQVEAELKWGVMWGKSPTLAQKLFGPKCGHHSALSATENPADGKEGFDFGYIPFLDRVSQDPWKWQNFVLKGKWKYLLPKT